uniref:Uncharacterized protein AlNc14C206G8804 n=1 Tax=Albugo laibachii Nc14 TaxID=890382 RepID=F0WQZ6_9STRA|nr:conserved hypothetical protein [Albugo laibachii Nc14]|eukprot:CCA23756.1 conserved hypothetical protein [Albugo laibachii Nc14]
MNDASTAANSAKIIAHLQSNCHKNAGKELILTDYLEYLKLNNSYKTLQSLPTHLKGSTRLLPIDWIAIYEAFMANNGIDTTERTSLWKNLLQNNFPALYKDGISLSRMASIFHSHFEPFARYQVFGSSGKYISTGTSIFTGKHIYEDFKNNGKMEKIATSIELQEAPNACGTPLPDSSKRLKSQWRMHADLGAFHNLVLALDSNLSCEVARALHALTILSCRNPHGRREDTPTFFVYLVPGLLDALYRQLKACELPVFPWRKAQDEFSQWNNRFQCLNLSPSTQDRAILHHKALVILNIIRNFVLSSKENEKPVAENADIIIYCIGLIKTSHVDLEVPSQYALDVLERVTHRIDFHLLNPIQNAPELFWAKVDMPLAVQLYQVKGILPLEYLLNQLHAILLGTMRQSGGIYQSPRARDALLRVLNILWAITQNPELHETLQTSKTMEESTFLHYIVVLVACPQDMFPNRKRRRFDPIISSPNNAFDMDYTSSESEGMEDDAKNKQFAENFGVKRHKTWRTPWEMDGLPIDSFEFGKVFSSSRNAKERLHSNRYAWTESTRNADSESIDWEISQAALCVLYHLSKLDQKIKIAIGKHPTGLSRILLLLTLPSNQIQHEKLQCMASGILLNVSKCSEIIPFLWPMRKELVQLACSSSDKVAKIVNTLLRQIWK